MKADPEMIRALVAWRERMGLTQTAAARALGRSIRSYQRLESGETDEISLETRLACAALMYGIKPIGAQK